MSRKLSTLLQISILWVAFNVVNSENYATSLQYPLTIGGYGGATDPKRFDFDSAGNLAIVGCTLDPILLGVTSV